MKTMLAFLTAAFLLCSITGDQYAQIDLGKFKGKDKKKEEKKKDDQKKDKIEAKSDKDQQKAKKNEGSSGSGLSPLTFGSEAPVVGFSKLLNKMQLDPVTGVLTFGEIAIKNIPIADKSGKDVTYGADAGEHKLTAVLKLKDQKIGTTAFRCSPRSMSLPWKPAEPFESEGFTNSHTLKQGGDYIIEFMIDGKVVDKKILEIAQIVNNTNKSGLFIKKPTELLGGLGFKNQNYGEPDPKSELIFKFFHAALNPEDVFNDEKPMSVRLIKEVQGGENEVMGGTFDGSLRHKSKWDMTDNLFFEKPGVRYQYISGNDIINNPGMYYIDVILGNDQYRYDFEIKNGKIVSPDFPGMDDEGLFWLKRRNVDRPRYETFRPTGSIAGMKNNIRMSVATVDGKTTKGVGENVAVSFSDGQAVNLNFYFDDATKNKLNYRDAELITTLKKDDQIIAQHLQFGLFNSMSFPIFAFMKDVETKLNIYTHFFMEAMAKMPPGAHKLTLVLEVASGNFQKVVGVQSLTFNSVKDNPRYTKQAAAIHESMSMSESELANVRFLKYAGPDYALYENNCGRIVWLRQDESKEYYLYPGDKGMFDRNGGPLEQWNFGTKKWKSIDDFSPAVTVFRLTDNEIAMLNFKQVPKDITDKLMTMVGEQFATGDLYLKRVEALIGKESATKYNDLLMMHGNLDFIKICK